MISALLAYIFLPLGIDRDVRKIEGWSVLIDRRLIAEERPQLEKVTHLLKEQLVFVRKHVPTGPLKELRKVPLYITADYPGEKPGAAYHPGAQWLKDHGRDVEMTKCVEFYNVSIFEKECQRMPVFVLHELAHAYHDRVLGFDEKRISDAFRNAVKSGSYDNVERWHGPGIPMTKEKSYAMTNVMEYFAECTEAYFGRNDFYPFVRSELEKVDPEMVKLLGEIWK